MRRTELLQGIRRSNHLLMAALSFLSALLIGHEVARMIDVVGAGQPLNLVGPPVLTGLNAKAIGERASKVPITDGETATMRGLMRLLSHAA